MQTRPLYMGGQINDARYMGNVFIMDRKHPDARLRALAEDVLMRIGGYGAPKKEPGRPKKGAGKGKAVEEAVDGTSIDVLPRFIVLAVEVKGDDEYRDFCRALYEGVALGMRKVFPALASQMQAHLAALGYGDYRVAPQSLADMHRGETATAAEIVDGAADLRVEQAEQKAAKRAALQAQLAELDSTVGANAVPAVVVVGDAGAPTSLDPAYFKNGPAELAHVPRGSVTASEGEGAVEIVGQIPAGMGPPVGIRKLPRRGLGG